MDKDELTDRFEQAAVEAEYATGKREDTEGAAKVSIIVRVSRMTLAVALIVLGIILMPLPGPGWLVVAGGFTLLAKDVAWADRVVRLIRKKVPGVPEDGKIPRSSIITMIVVTLAFTSASLWWALR